MGGWVGGWLKLGGRGVHARAELAGGAFAAHALRAGEGEEGEGEGFPSGWKTYLPRPSLPPSRPTGSQPRYEPPLSPFSSSFAFSKPLTIPPPPSLSLCSVRG